MKEDIRLQILYFGPSPLQRSQHAADNVAGDPCNNWRPTWGSKRDILLTMSHAAHIKLTGLDPLQSSGAQQHVLDNIAVFTVDQVAEVLTMLTTRTQPQPVLPTYSGNRNENIDTFLNKMEHYFVSYSTPEYQRLTTVVKQLRGNPAKFWIDYQYFIDGYDEFIQELFKEFAISQAMADRRAVIRCRQEKDKTAPNALPEQTKIVTPSIEATPNTSQMETADVKCDPHGKPETVMLEAREEETAHPETKEHATNSKYGTCVIDSRAPDPVINVETEVTLDNVETTQTETKTAEETPNREVADSDATQRNTRSRRRSIGNGSIDPQR
ncbi:hypothetical protein FQA39_LY02102 [Lamprigera yunnana]|nr:hypothetical protein FQA39_LY02102 [Lamprigera yunnana]